MEFPHPSSLQKLNKIQASTAGAETRTGRAHVEHHQEPCWAGARLTDAVFGSIDLHLCPGMWTSNTIHSFWSNLSILICDVATKMPVQTSTAGAQTRTGALLKQQDPRRADVQLIDHSLWVLWSFQSRVLSPGNVVSMKGYRLLRCLAQLEDLTVPTGTRAKKQWAENCSFARVESFVFGWK